MKQIIGMRRWYLALGAVLLLLAGLRFLFNPAEAVADMGEPYRVELVQNDPYKVQTGMNSMAKQGWTYVSSITRTDGKLMLVFRREPN